MGELVGGRARDPRYRCSFHDRQQIRNPDLNSQIAHRRSFTYRRAYEAGDRYNEAPPRTAIDDPKRGIDHRRGAGCAPQRRATPVGVGVGVLLDELADKLQRHRRRASPILAS